MIIFLMFPRKQGMIFHAKYQILYWGPGCVCVCVCVVGGGGGGERGGKKH